MDVAAPNSDHAPAGSSQLHVVAGIPSLIAIDLRTPELRIGYRRGVVVRASMPPTAIHEDRDPTRTEDDVWLRPEHASMDAVAKAQAP
jgi:hypothetical protein